MSATRDNKVEFSRSIDIFTTKTFTVFDYRSDRYPHNRGISITAGQGDGLYQLNLPELKELKELVEDLIQELESKP